MLGYTKAEFLHLSIEDIAVLDDPEARTAQRIRNESGHYEGILKFKRKDGTQFNAEVTSVIYTDENGETRSYASIRDITEKRKAEQQLRDSEKRFRALIENNKDVIILSASDGSMVYASPSVNGLLGYLPEELLSTSALELMHPDEVQNNIGHLTWVVENPSKSIFKVQRLRHKDGSWRWIEATSTSQLNDPAVNAIVSNLRDVSERMIAEQEMEKLNQSLERKVNERTIQLQEANKALESFSYMAAHDLQSPLRIQAGYAHILTEEYADRLGKDGIEVVEAIVQNTRHMKKLVTDLLDFSRISHLVLSKQQTQLDKMVREVTDHLLLKGNSAHAEITISELGDLLCDHSLVKQVWINLISNALKYSARKDKPTIEIGSFIQEGAKIFYVKDNGAGFNQQYAHKLFAVFQRLHSSSDFEGTGVGLAIVNNIIVRHNGRIWAEGEIDKGATFYFTIPE